MNSYDLVVDNRPLRWSVGKYIGKRRVIIAWFENEFDAMELAERFSFDFPGIKFDWCKSLF